jgi:hypothetical protein
MSEEGTRNSLMLMIRSRAELEDTKKSDNLACFDGTGLEKLFKYMKCS